MSKTDSAPSVPHSAPSNIPTEPKAPNTSKITSTSKKPNKFRLIVIIIFACILLSALGFTYYYFLLQNTIEPVIEIDEKL